MERNYYVYMLKCKDKSFYVGVTNSINRRLIEHQTGFNKKCYTYDRRPVMLVFCAHYQYIADAIAREKQLQGWSRKKKMALIKEQWWMLHSLSQCANDTIRSA